MKYPNIPQNPNFSSGPCAKYKNWSLNKLSGALLGRSHRSKNGKVKLKKCIEETKSLLNLPSEYLLGILPGSNTGAFEIALWNFLGSRQVDILAWESFGYDWVNDITNQLKLSETRVFKAEYGQIPDFKKLFKIPKEELIDKSNELWRLIWRKKNKIKHHFCSRKII